MTTVILAFICGFTAYFFVDIIASRLAGETRFSLPTAPLVIGIICGSSAHFLGTWAAVGIFFLVTLVRAQEVAKDRQV
jgi:hypothetical protein